MEETKKNKLIHIGIIQNGKTTLQLRELTKHHYSWFESEKETEVYGINPREAIKNARRFWQDFKTILCGRRFTLPERDEHGENALFHQMAASLESMNGIYFDEELGHSCIVQDIPSNIRKLYYQYKEEGSL